ncbi:MAG: RNA polymerase subunit sigma-24 [Thermoanaerobacteraceae bacterium]|jgi:hypothetical protein|nr:RNA polymerase subunit sigma-24 [Thermoanaerobacteraceae bacterium]
MTKKELSQLRYLNKEIELLKKQIAEAEYAIEKRTAVDTVSGSNSEWPYQRRTFRIEGIDMKWYEKRLKRLKRKLKRRLEELMEKREEIEEYISTVPDSLIRQILTLRYVNGLSWQQIAVHVGGGNTADSVRMMHNRFLKKK